MDWARGEYRFCRVKLYRVFKVWLERWAEGLSSRFARGEMGGRRF
jgi:hypothetical protein